MHPDNHLYFQEAALEILRYRSIFVQQLHQLPKGGGSKPVMISLIRGGWGVKNSGKPTDVIVERSLRIYMLRYAFFITIYTNI